MMERNIWCWCNAGTESEFCEDNRSIVAFRDGLLLEKKKKQEPVRRCYRFLDAIDCTSCVNDRTKR